jgi:hypothetical protein
MTAIGFYRGGVYPSESVTGIILNLALFQKVPPTTILRMISSRPASTIITEHYHEADVTAELANQIWLPYPARCFPGQFMLSHKPRGLKFKFCLSCLEVGYHSVFFCMPQVKVCAIHRQPLAVGCERCQNFRTINAADYPCDSCGFYLASSSDQILFRLDAQLKLQIRRAVGALNKWYTNMCKYAKSGSILFIKIEKMDDYDINPIDATFIKALGWPLPLGLCDETVARRRPRFIRWVTNENFQTVLDWNAACKRLEKIHFPKPCSNCESSLESLSGYWDGEKLSHVVCLKPFIDFLVRIRCSSLSQFSIPAGHYKNFGFDYLEVLQNVQPARFGFPAALIRVYFLKLVYDLSVYLNLGYSVRLRLLPWEGLLYDLSRPGMREGEGLTILGVSPLNGALCCHTVNGEGSTLNIIRKDNFGWVVESGHISKGSIVLNL